MLASGADDAQILVWSPDGKIQQRIPHPAPVQSLSWSPESQRVVTGSANQITFLTALTGAILARSTRHTSTVTSVQWTVNNQMQVVSGSLDERAIVWETTHYQPQAVFAGHDAPILAVSWGSDGQTVASASQGGAVRLWNAETIRELHGFYQDAQAPMRACAFAPTGTTLAVGGNDGVIRLWNGFVCQQQVTNNEGVMCQDIPTRLHASHQPIRALSWSPDGHYLASGSDDGSFSVWNPDQGHQPLFSITVQPGTAVHSIAWSPDGKQLATASGTSVILWSLV
jgi:WD40 repeat protein